MKAILIFCINRTLHLLITPVGALEHNTPLFSGVSDTHKYASTRCPLYWLIKAWLCLDLSMFSRVFSV